MCGKYRINLGRKRLELMAKMHTYYMSNAKNELSYYGHELTSEEISNIIRNGGLFDKGEDDNINEINKSEDNRNDDVFVIIEWNPLHIENVINLDLISNKKLDDDDIQISDQETDDDSDIREKETDNFNKEEEYEYDSEIVIKEEYENENNEEY